VQVIKQTFPVVVLAHSTAALAVVASVQVAKEALRHLQNRQNRRDRKVAFRSELPPQTLACDSFTLFSLLLTLLSISLAIFSFSLTLNNDSLSVNFVLETLAHCGVLISDSLIMLLHYPWIYKGLYELEVESQEANLRYVD